MQLFLHYISMLVFEVVRDAQFELHKTVHAEYLLVIVDLDDLRATSECR